jgi:uncharacterized membrane protein YheB (UPF0754 family)
MNYWLFVIPVISALLGWLIHSIAIRIFLHRVLPRKQAALAVTIGKAAAQEFASFNAIEEKINDPKNFERLLPAIDAHIDTFLNEKLKQEMPFITMFITNKTTDKLKEIFIRELQVLFPQVIGQFAGNLRESIDVEKLVAEKINKAPLPHLIQDKLSSELNAVRVLGAVSGLVIGLLQVLITVLTT